MKYFLIFIILLSPEEQILRGIKIVSLLKNSQLEKIFSYENPQDLYLIEFNGNSFPSENLSFQIVLKNFKEFLKNPNKGDFTKLTILTFKDGISKINKIDIYNWDGLLDFEEMVRSLKIPKDTEIIYHNSFKLLKNAKEKIKNNEFEEAKNYLNLIKIIDPKSQEAFEGEKILNEIKNEELKIQINKKIVEAERLEDSKKYIEAIKIYEEIFRDYNEEIIPKEVLKEKILKIKNNLKEIEEKEIKEQEILKEKMEKERREVEKRKKEMELEEKKVREEKRRVLLNNLRILKNQKKFEEGLEIIEQLKTSYGQEEDVKKEIGLFIKEAGKAMFEEAINFFNNSEYQKSLKFLYYANCGIIQLKKLKSI